jgi:hypothetical protein
VFVITMFWFFVVALFLNLLVIYFSLPFIKKVAKWLTVEDTPSEDLPSNVVY